MDRDQLIATSATLLAGRLAATGGALRDGDIVNAVKDACRLIRVVDKFTAPPEPDIPSAPIELGDIDAD